MLTTGLIFDQDTKPAAVSVVPPAMRTHIGAGAIEEPPAKRGKGTKFKFCLYNLEFRDFKVLIVFFLSLLCWQ